MGKEERRLVGEIIFVLLAMLITIPICANASNDSYYRRGNMILNQNVSVAIRQEENGKQICIRNVGGDKVLIGLIMKIPMSLT